MEHSMRMNRKGFTGELRAGKVKGRENGGSEGKCKERGIKVAAAENGNLFVRRCAFKRLSSLIE